MYYLWGYDVTEEHISREKLLHDNKIQFLGKAAAGLAHEIKNPLTFVKANLEYLELTENKQYDNRSDTYISIQEGISRINEIIESFRMTSYRISSDKNIEPISQLKAKSDLKSVIDKSLKMALVTTDKNLVINNQIKSTVDVNIEEGPFIQCLINILQNSIDSLNLKKENRLITICYDQRSNIYTTIKIIDNGEGPKTEAIQEIFRPFTSFGGKHKTNSGLGLYITKNILNKYNGKIEAFHNQEGFNIAITLKNFQPKAQVNTLPQT